MPIGTAVRGTNITSSASFYKPDGTPFAPTTPVRWVVRDFDNNQIASGVGRQNIKSPAEWTCSFTIPLTAPATRDTLYSLVWLAANSQNSQTATEYFSVQDDLEEPPYETAQVVILGSPFNAELWIPCKATTLSLRITDYRGAVCYVQTGTANFKSQAKGPGWLYRLPVNTANAGNSPYLNEKPAAVSNTTTIGTVANLVAQSSGVNSMFLYWNYTDPQGNQETIINRLYVINGTMVRLMDDMRRFLDRIRNAATIPQLQLTDVDLAHFALQGMDKVNGTPPVNNGTFALGNLPEALYDNVKMAACIRFLQSQTLALGMASFEFNGQAVSLTQDQAQYLQGLEGTLSSEYDNTITTNKKALIRSGYFASVGGYYGPTALLVGKVPYGFSTFFLPSLPFLG